MFGKKKGLKYEKLAEKIIERIKEGDWDSAVNFLSCWRGWVKVVFSKVNEKNQKIIVSVSSDSGMHLLISYKLYNDVEENLLIESSNYQEFKISRKLYIEFIAAVKTAYYKNENRIERNDIWTIESFFEVNK